MCGVVRGDRNIRVAGGFVIFHPLSTDSCVFVFVFVFVSVVCVFVAGSNSNMSFLTVTRPSEGCGTFKANKKNTIFFDCSGYHLPWREVS